MSIFDPVERIPDAPTWRCPHCRTLQPETSRCRGCSRAAVSCASCHYFRPSFVGALAFCATDPTREPLGGHEVRPCWVSLGTTSGPDGGLLDALLSPSTVATAVPVPGAPAGVSAPRSVQQPVDGEVDQARSERRGRLVEAPHVAPAGTLVSELRRRSGQDHG
jgi:hypothetical protein